MNTIHVLIFFAFFVGGAFAYGAIERRFARKPRPARGHARRRRGTAPVRRCPRSLAPPLDFPKWSEKAARLFLAGGCARFNDQTIQRVKEQG